MHLNVLTRLTFTVFFLSTGCAGYRTTVNYPQPLPLGKEIKSYHAPKQIPEVKTPLLTIAEPTDTLTFQQALSLALLRNPQLAVFSWEVRAREAQAVQASLLPNPEVEVEIENIGGSGDLSGFDQSETTVLLGQLFELGGKRKKRTRVAALESDLAAWDYEIKRLEVLTEVTQAFVDVLSLQQRLTLNTELIRLAQEFVDIVARRVEAGATSPAEVSRARVALSNARIELERTRRELQAARKRLAATWGSTTPTFQQAVGELDTSLSMPDFDRLLTLLTQNPEVARWAMEMQQRRAVLSLAKAQGIPDPSIGGGFRRLNESRDNAFVLALSLPLPIFDRNQGATEEARARISQAEWQKRATETAIATQISEAYQSLSTAYSEATMLQSSVLPEAQKAYDTINEGYRLGKFGFLDVLDAQRTLFDARSQYLLSLTDYQKAKAELEKLIGQSL
ncbi:MAG: TolC family protein, partial [bacterium]